MAQDQEENRKAWPKVVDNYTVGGNTVDAQKVWEPEPGYDQGGQYGKVQVQTYRGGQSVEIDNTPGGERIKVSHPAGSYTEMQADGDVVARSNGDDYEVVAGTKNQRVQGDINIHADGSKNEKIGGQSNIQVAGMTINSDGSIKLVTPHLDIVGGSVTHNGVNIGDTHKHTGVLPGGGLSGVPVGGGGGGAAAQSSAPSSGGGSGGSGGGDPPSDAPGATQEYVDEKVADVVDGAELDTLSQLSESIGNDPTFSNTIMGLISNTAAQFANYYTESQVDNMFINYYTESQMDSLLLTKLDTASYTAADILTKLITVDGAGSGLDADLLDGQSSAYYAVDSAVVKYTSQSKTPAEQGQARANIGFITGDRSPIINGNFDIWQAGTSFSQTTPAYTADGWLGNYAGSGYTITHARQTFALGQTDVPGNPLYYYRVTNTTVGSITANVIECRIESVSTLQNQTFTLTFYMKGSSAFTLNTTDSSLIQNFGTGGSPSTQVATAFSTFTVNDTAITTSWKKITVTGTLPSISGKTLGAAGDMLRIQLYIPLTAALVVDLARVSLVEGDATAEADPYPKRHIGHALSICQRYYETGGGVHNASLYSFVSFQVQKRVSPTVTATSGSSIVPYINGFYSTHSATTNFTWYANSKL